MRYREILSNKRLRPLKFIVCVLLSLILIDILFGETHPILNAIRSLQDFYLLASERFANIIIHTSGNKISIINHNLVLKEVVLPDFVPELRYQKICILILFVIWMTRASIIRKCLFSIALIILHFSFVSIYLAAEAALIETGYPNPTPLSIPHTIALLVFLTAIFLWYRFNKDSIIKDLSRLKIKPDSIRKKSTPLFIVVCLYIVVNHFLLIYFDYYPWINFLFNSSHKILSLFGIDSVVEPSLLIGKNGSIYMAKYCLGFKTMFLFAALIYLTGNNKLTQWTFIVLGIIFLNFINIIRFVLLFIHIQKNGGYILAIDLHDLYNYTIYIIVFILWIIWFEKFSDIKNKTK